MYPGMTNGCKMMWSLFGNGHGKGPHDGIGTIIKRLIQHEQLNAHGEKFINVKEVVNFICKQLFTCPKSSYTCKRKFFLNFFWHVKSGDIDCKFTICACDAIEGTMKICCIYALNKTTMTQLLVKNLAYFCANYLDG
jgi:hypothetical protein